FVTTVIEFAAEKLKKDVPVMLAVFLMQVFDKERSQGRFNLKPSYRSPGGIKEGPIAKLVHLEDDFLDIFDHRPVLIFTRIQSLFGPLAFYAQRNAVGH